MASLISKARHWLKYRDLPDAAQSAWRADLAGLPQADPGPERVIEEGVRWLLRAQDCSMTQDGGLARHFSLVTGWSASYPETTGYAVPTMLRHEEVVGQTEMLSRVRRMLDWLISVQFPDGAFPGGMIDQSPQVPVVFNTGQILIGLAAAAERDARYTVNMRRASEWLLRVQEADGSWQSHHSPFASPGPKTYDAHIAIGLIRAGSVAKDDRYLESGFRQIQWVIGQQLANGFLPQCCLTDHTRPLTHTLGYALRGILEAYHASQNERYLVAAQKMGDGILGALRDDGWLAGRLDARWNPAADWVCLTGSSQIAECWLLLYRATGIEKYRKAGQQTNRFVRRTVKVEGSPEIRGAVKGSFPASGGYDRWRFPDWACKFTIDANDAEMQIVK
ncbi:MAG TPA: prenyltransferase/squalene oxidase repeat-containing protein [Rhizomicrobium sp.]|jgi:hypothetical protein|nr:prenyltransferase/squalene oxidase repeat-containing protein [Rhizomicrobium sp.]